jgi:hypothetical protein
MLLPGHEFVAVFEVGSGWRSLEDRLESCSDEETKLKVLDRMRYVPEE